MNAEVQEQRFRELRLRITVPDEERKRRPQPFTRSGREYEVQEVRVVLPAMDGKEGSVKVTFYGPLVTKAGLSTKVRVDEQFYSFDGDTGLAACGPSTRQAIEERIAAWRRDGAL